MGNAKKIYSLSEVADSVSNLNSQLIVSEFSHLGYSLKWVDNDSFLVDVSGKWTGFSITNSTNTSVIARRKLRNKALTKELFTKSGISVPSGSLFISNQYHTNAKAMKTTQ